MFHGSYLKEDVRFLLKPIEITETGITEKETLIQSGKKHYSEMISPEYVPSEEYMEVFYKALSLNRQKMAENVLSLARLICKEKKDPILVSLARAGTPVGVLLKRALRDIMDIDVPHYSISIIRDRGVDQNALDFILNNHENADRRIVFIDGWTGKGVISYELKKFIRNYNKFKQTNISSDLYVLSDISGKAEYSSTTEDYLIPSSVLNSTISGLVSRSILNAQYISKFDFHGCKYYEEFKEKDLSLWFIEQIMGDVISLNGIEPGIKNEDKNYLSQICESFIKTAMSNYNVKHINYIKPGVGETTRVLLRRVPDRILIKDKNSQEIEHLLVLAEEKKVLIEEIPTIPYKAVGIISNLER